MKRQISVSISLNIEDSLLGISDKNFMRLPHPAIAKSKCARNKCTQIYTNSASSLYQSFWQVCNKLVFGNEEEIFVVKGDITTIAKYE